jgi:hypothetical protein
MGSTKNKNKFSHPSPPPQAPKKKSKKKGSPKGGGTTLPSGELVDLGNVAVQPDNKSVNTATSTNNTATTAPIGSVPMLPQKKIVNQVKAPVQSSTTQGKIVDQTTIGTTTTSQGTMPAKDVTSSAEHSKKDATVARNDIVIMTKIPPEQKNEIPQAKFKLPRTPLKYAQASELLTAAKEPVDLILPTLAAANDEVTPHTKQRMTRSVSKQDFEAGQQLLQDMEAAKLDDVDSDDYTYKGSDLHQDTRHHNTLLILITK